MGLDAPDQDIINLLTKLKQAESEYPQHLLVARRERYLRRMAEVSLGIGSGTGAHPSLTPTKPPTASAIASKVVETALMVAIVVEASAAAYVYREQLSGLVRNLVRSTEVREILSPPGITTPFITAIINSSPEASVTLSSGETATPILPTVSASPAEGVVAATPIPGLAGATLPVNATATQPQVTSTPMPSGEDGDNGNHYGQTPKPERTKENNGNDDPPPKDDNGQPPKKDPKPTKSK